MNYERWPAAFHVRANSSNNNGTESSCGSYTSCIRRGHYNSVFFHWETSAEWRSCVARDC